MTNEKKIRAPRKGLSPKPSSTRGVRPAIKGLNVRLLRKVQKHILEEPRRLIMGSSLEKRSDYATNKFRADYGRDQQFAKCGTAACIAGWTNILSGAKTDAERMCRFRAAGKLGIEAGIGWITHPLFFDKNWPEPFASGFRTARTPLRRARITAQRINHFIATGE